MRIGQVAPPWRPLPPSGHGGTELLVSVLADQLAADGHAVTLFAPGGTTSRARVVETPPRPAGLDRMSWLGFEEEQMAVVARSTGDLDVLHVHTEHQLQCAADLDLPAFLTLHDRPSDRLAELCRAGRVVPPSRAYADGVPGLPLAEPVHHGIDVDRYRPAGRPGEHLLFLGRMVPEKGLHRAVLAARAAGLPLVAVGVRGGFPREEAYYEHQVRPLLGPDVTLIDEVGFDRKVELLAGARALLFPIDWEEPFGLVMVEAMACGTPVIGTDRATVPELVDDGRTGLVLPVEGWVERVARALRDGALDAVDRRACREHAVRHFSGRTMARCYAARYEQALG